MKRSRAITIVAAFAALLGSAAFAATGCGSSQLRVFDDEAGTSDFEGGGPLLGSDGGDAKKVCVGCEVRAECLEYALANDERFGIWGGLSERERRKLKKRAV